jgi:hypothetical protein
MPLATDELIGLTARYLDALVARDVAYLREHSLDTPEYEFVGIGSLPDEQWGLPQLIDHLGEFPPTTFVDSKPNGYTDGNVAWLIDHPTCVLPSGERLAMRATVVLKRAGKAWKVVHWHVSEGVHHDL